jgi:nucleoside-diphosphate-sugar epimerase
MRVFVTDATGFVGSAVVQDLLGAGHEVLGLARSDAGAAALAQTGAGVLRGSLDDLDVLRRGAREADGVIHTAFNHDFSKFAEHCEQDRRAIEALGDALSGSERPLVVTAGIALLTQGRPALEDDLAPPAGPAYPRASEQTALALAERGVHACVVRLPPSVHGEGEHGFVPMLIDIARERGVSAYIDGGEGGRRWSAVHRRDAARAFRLALERGVRGGRYHAIAEEAVLLRDVAAVIARRLGVPLEPRSPEQADEAFGWFASFAGLEMTGSSARTCVELQWAPREIELLADIDSDRYFPS